MSSGSTNGTVGSREVASRKVSVVVPVWNPGPNLTRCVDSLLAQTLPRTEYEIVLVDDGSTDGTAGRLDALSAAHPDFVRVVHIANSGWPGRPRNVGIEQARGEFVHLVDNDDVLAPFALSRLLAAAVAHDADVIMGRPASDFRGLAHHIYRAPRWVGTLADLPDLTTTLTPHKMFRRDLLLRHGIRFPEGPAPLEDQLFVMAAYLHAGRIAICSDGVYYSYLRRIGSGRNAGDRVIDPARQCSAVTQVLDVIDDVLAADGVDDPTLRDRLYRRFYRINLLGRLSEQAMLDYTDVERDALVDAVRAVVTERIPTSVDDGSGAAHRMQGVLLRADDRAALLAQARQYRVVGIRSTLRSLTVRDGALVLDLDGYVVCGGEAVRCELHTDGWLLPESLAPGAPPHTRLLDARRDEPDVEVSLVSRSTHASFGHADGLRFEVTADGLLRIHGRVPIDPLTAQGGRPLDDGLWDVLVRMRFAGWNRTCAVRTTDVGSPLAAPLVLGGGRLIRAYHASRDGRLAFDVGPWAISSAAVIAERLTLTAERRALHLTVPLDGSGSLPEAALVLVPADPELADLAVLPVALSAGDGAGSGRLTVPRRLVDGCWDVWLQIVDDTAPPAQLPYRVTLERGRPTVERVLPFDDMQVK